MLISNMAHPLGQHIDARGARGGARVQNGWRARPSAVLASELNMFERLGVWEWLMLGALHRPECLLELLERERDGSAIAEGG